MTAAESKVLLFDVAVSNDADDDEEGGVELRPIFDQTIRSHCIKLFHG